MVRRQPLGTGLFAMQSRAGTEIRPPIVRASKTCQKSWERSAPAPPQRGDPCLTTNEPAIGGLVRARAAVSGHFPVRHGLWALVGQHPGRRRPTGYRPRHPWARVACRRPRIGPGAADRRLTSSAASARARRRSPCSWCSWRPSRCQFWRRACRSCLPERCSSA